MRGMLPGFTASSARTPSAPIARPSTPPIEREQHAFGEQLADDAAAAGADGGADGDLARAAGGARQQQVGDVGAGDQQHAADRAQQDE